MGGILARIFESSKPLSPHQLIVSLCFTLSWILYEKPNFEGHPIPLEEGELELSGLWGIEDVLEGNEAESAKPVVIGSIRHVVQVGYGKTRIH